MRTWDQVEETGQCTADDDLASAKQVCQFSALSAADHRALPSCTPDAKVIASPHICSLQLQHGHEGAESRDVVAQLMEHVMHVQHMTPPSGI